MTISTSIWGVSGVAERRKVHVDAATENAVVALLDFAVAQEIEMSGGMHEV